MEKCIYCGNTLLNEPSKVSSYVKLVELCPTLRKLPEKLYDHLMKHGGWK